MEDPKLRQTVMLKDVLEGSLTNRKAFEEKTITLQKLRKYLTLINEDCVK